MPAVTGEERALREAVVATARAMAETAFTHGTSGNVSVRWQEGCLITPTGVDYAELTAGEICHLDAGGHPVPGGLKPSSEWRIHRDVYAARPDAAAIVHAHPPHATALACTHRGIPAFHYEVALAGGADIRCAGYATYGTQALSDAALAALADRRACLLANHGLLAIGREAAGALKLARAVEALARQYLLTLTIGGPVLLDEAQMAEVLEKIAHYGKQDRDA